MEKPIEQRVREYLQFVINRATDRLDDLDATRTIDWTGMQVDAQVMADRLAVVRAVHDHSVKPQ